MPQKNMVDLITNLTKAKNEFYRKQYDLICDQAIESYNKVIENSKTLSEEGREMAIKTVISHIALSNYMMGKKDAFEYGN